MATTDALVPTMTELDYTITVAADGTASPTTERLLERNREPATFKAVKRTTARAFGRTGKYIASKFHPSKEEVAEFCLNRVPLIRTVMTYKVREYLFGDIVAGLSIATILIPQSIAYATTAGLPPVYGLYSSFIPMAMYALFGTCQQLNVAPVSILSLVVFQTITAIVPYSTNATAYIQSAIYLCFISGLIQLFMGLFRLGFLMRFLSPALVTGFISGSAINIGCSQLANLFGVTIPSSNYFWQIIYYVCVQLPNTKWLAITMGILTIAIIITVRKWKRAIPIAFIMVVINTFISWCLVTYNHSQPPLPITGTLPAGLPSFVVPTLYSSSYLGSLIAGGFLCVAIGYMESYSLALKMGQKHGYKVDPNQELMALGTANLVGSFFQSYPVTGSFSRTAECDLQGGKTILYSIICLVAVIISLLFLTPVFYYIPKSTLAAVIISAVYRLIDVKKMRVYYRTCKMDFFVAVVSFLAVLGADTEVGLLIGFCTSLLPMLWKLMAPTVASLGTVKIVDGPTRHVDPKYFPQAAVSVEVSIIRFENALVFLNSQNFVEQVDRISSSSAGKNPNDWLIESHIPPFVPPKVVVLDASSLIYVDTPGALAIHKAAEILHKKSIHFLLAGVRSDVKHTMAGLNLLDGVGPRTFFLTVEDAVTYANENGLRAVPYTPATPSGKSRLAEDPSAMELLATSATVDDMNDADSNGGANGPGRVVNDVVLGLPDLGI